MKNFDIKKCIAVKTNEYNYTALYIMWEFISCTNVKIKFTKEILKLGK